MVNGSLKLTRRGLLGAAVACSFAGVTRPARAQAPVLFGSAFDREIFSDTAYADLIAQTCQIAAVENSFKFDWLCPDGPTPDFTATDRLVEFAASRNIALRGTALIWNEWVPSWVSSLSSGEIENAFDRHLDEVVGRYAGRVQGWDVVNEPFFQLHGKDGGYRKGVWLDAMGPGYIARAFKRAAVADPKAQLVLNEAFCEQNDEWGTSIRPLLLSLVRELKQSGVKVDGVGFQAHLKPHLPFDDQAFAAYLAEMAALDVDIYITELDVDDSSLPDDVALRDAAVAKRCGDFLTAVMQVPRVKAVISWHLSDRYSWYANTDWYRDQISKFGGQRDREPRSHLFDKDLKAKSAFEAVQRAISARR